MFGDSSAAFAKSFQIFEQFYGNQLKKIVPFSHTWRPHVAFQLDGGGGVKGLGGWGRRMLEVMKNKGRLIQLINWVRPPKLNARAGFSNPLLIAGCGTRS